LFEALKDDFSLIFVSNSTQTFPYAKKAFAELLSPTQHGRERQGLARFFWLKRMAEEKRFKELAHKDVIEWHASWLGEDRLRFTAVTTKRDGK
jgi:hypothetical protein